MSWAQLAAIIADTGRAHVDQHTVERRFCPEDGAPLQTNSAGVRGCTFCGWRSDQQGEICP